MYIFRQSQNKGFFLSFLLDAFEAVGGYRISVFRLILIFFVVVLQIFQNMKFQAVIFWKPEFRLPAETAAPMTTHFYTHDIIQPFPSELLFFNRIKMSGLKTVQMFSTKQLLTIMMTRNRAAVSCLAFRDRRS